MARRKHRDGQPTPYFAPVIARFAKPDRYKRPGGKKIPKLQRDPLGFGVFTKAMNKAQQLRKKRRR